LFLSSNTVANHIRNILTKTKTSNRTEAAAYAASHGLLAS
jgi:DNA-binding NarL/FixJ family response regulator